MASACWPETPLTFTENCLLSPLEKSVYAVGFSVSLNTSKFCTGSSDLKSNVPSFDFCDASSSVKIFLSLGIIGIGRP